MDLGQCSVLHLNALIGTHASHNRQLYALRDTTVYQVALFAVASYSNSLLPLPYLCQRALPGKPSHEQSLSTRITSDPYDNCHVFQQP